MAVPTPSRPQLANTAGGSFTAQTQGGTILGNTKLAMLSPGLLLLKITPQVLVERLFLLRALTA